MMHYCEIDLTPGIIVYIYSNWKHPYHLRKACGLNTKFSVSKPITNLNCVFMSYMPQKLFPLVANYNINIVLLGKFWQKWLPQSGFFVFSKGNLLNSRTLGQSHACTKEPKLDYKHLTNYFSSTVHHKGCQFHAILKHFDLKTYKYKYEYEVDGNSKTGSIYNVVPM